MEIIDDRSIKRPRSSFTFGLVFHFGQFGGTMARTKPRKTEHLTAEQRAAAAERSARKRAGIRKASRILSSQEIETLHVKEPCARVQSETSSGSETEPEDDTFSRPEPKQVIKLRAPRSTLTSHLVTS